MFFTRLLQIILGYVRFKAEGVSIEKFLNLAAKSGISLWDLHRQGMAIFANVRKNRYKMLLPLSEKANLRLTIVSKKGLPFVVGRHRFRFGFLVGAILYIAVLVYFSGFIWSVEINGNSEVSTREIQYTLGDLGLSAGMRKDGCNLKKLEQQALLKLPGLSWIHINLEGGVAHVEVGERTPRPEIVPENVPCNIKAAQSGQIISMRVYEGNTVLKIHDTVQKGELIVSGVIEEPQTKITRYVHASAEIIARTKRQMSVTVPYKATQQEDTGKVVKRFTLNILNLSLPLYRGEPQGKFRRMVYKSPLVIFGVQLPVSVKTSVFYEYRDASVTLSQKKALEKAQSMLSQKEKTELSAAKIEKRSQKMKTGADSLTLTGFYTCEEDIAVSQEVTFTGN